MRVREKKRRKKNMTMERAHGKSCHPPPLAALSSASDSNHPQRAHQMNAEYISCLFAVRVVVFVVASTHATAIYTRAPGQIVRIKCVKRSRASE